MDTDASVKNEFFVADIRNAAHTGEPDDSDARLATEERSQVCQVRHIPEKKAEGNVVGVLGARGVFTPTGN